MPEAFQARSDLGYQLAHIGKWHLSHISDGPGAPNRAGWPYFAGPITGGAVSDYFSYAKNVNGRVSRSTTYATTDQVNDALAVISGAAAAGWPYFITLAFNAPHGPYHKPPNELHIYDFLPPITPNANARPYYEAMIQAMDTEIGRLLAQLNLATTTVIFIGDNGTPARVLAAPYSHGKSSIYETGIRVPLLIAGSGVANPGRISNALVNSVDLYTTILALAGIDVSAVVPPGVKIDGVNLVPILADVPTANSRQFAYADRFIQVYNQKYQRAIRNQSYKLVERPGRRQFFNLDSDPFETTDLLARVLTPGESQSFISLSNALSSLLASP